MITLACPNESFPEWIEIAAALGERRAILAFLRNGNDVPHDIEQALEILKLDKIKWRSADGKTLEQIKQGKAGAGAPKADATPAKPADRIRLKVIRD